MSCKSQDYRLSRIKIEERRCTPLSFLMIQKLTFLERSQSFFVEFQGVTFSTFSVYTVSFFPLPSLSFLYSSLYVTLSSPSHLSPSSFIFIYTLSFSLPYIPLFTPFTLPFFSLQTFPFSSSVPSPSLPFNHPSSLYRPSPSNPPYLPLHFHPSSLIHLSFLLLFTSFSYFYYIPSSFLLIPSHSPLYVPNSS